MICYGEHTRYAYPSWKQLAWILTATGEVQNPRCDVGIDGCYSEESEESSLRCIVYEPSRHEAVREEEREVRRSKTLHDVSGASITPEQPRQHTHNCARNTSVTVKRRSKLQPPMILRYPYFPALPDRSSSTTSTSPTNVNKHLKPHHAAGTVLRARHSNRGMYH